MFAVFRVDCAFVFVSGFTGNVVNRAGEGCTAELRRLWSAQYFDAFQIGDVGATYTAANENTVNKKRGVRCATDQRAKLTADNWVIQPPAEIGG